MLSAFVLVLLGGLTANAKVLYVVGMESEAKLVRASNTDVIIGGGSASELTGLLAKVDPTKYTSVINFGLVGGLSPSLAAGGVVLPTEIITVAGTHYPTEPKIVAEFANQMKKCAVAYHEVQMAGVAAPVVDPADRANLRQLTGADVADDQSQVTASWAQMNKLPFAVMGAISDDWQTTLPPAALIPLTPQGTPDVVKIALSVLEHPGQIPALSQLGKNMNTALGNLSQVINCQPTYQGE